MAGKSARLVAAYSAGALLAVALGSAVVYLQPLPVLFAVAASLAAVLVLSGSPAGDWLCFLVLFSGPPRIRARSPLASLSGAVDTVVLLHLAVWLIGALWVLRQWYQLAIVERRRLRLSWMHGLGVCLAVVLGLSLFESPGRLLTLFRAAQLLVMILFGFLWVEKLGGEATLHRLLWGYALIGLAIAVAAFVRPDLVFAGDRIRGDYIANTGAIGVMGIILLLSRPQTPKPWLVLPLLALFVALLVLSLTRSAYVAAMIFLALAAIRRPDVQALRSVVAVLGLLAASALLFGMMPAIVAWVVRDPASLATLSERIPLWRFLVPIMWRKSPILGLGFYAATRVYGTQYNVSIGTAHSAFVEVLVGGGLLSFVLLMALVTGALLRSLRSFVRNGRQAQVFVTFALLLTVLSIGVVSEEMIIASPTALSLWLVVSLIEKQRARER
jgi:O-antigen ligase